MPVTPCFAMHPVIPCLAMHPSPRARPFAHPAGPLLLPPSPRTPAGATAI